MVSESGLAIKIGLIDLPSPIDMKRRNSSFDLVEPTVEDPKTPVDNRRFSVYLYFVHLGSYFMLHWQQVDIPMDNGKIMRSIPQLPTFNDLMPPPVPTRQSRNTSPSKSKNSELTCKIPKEDNNKEDSSQNHNLYDINRRKAIGVGLPPTPKVPVIPVSIIESLLKIQTSNYNFRLCFSLSL